LKAILNNTTKNGTVHLSCRIEKNVYDILSKDANEKGISLNSLVNSITKKFVIWDIHSSDIHLVSLTKEVLKKFSVNLMIKHYDKLQKILAGLLQRSLFFFPFMK